MMSVTRFTLSTISSIVLPASPTSCAARVDLVHRVADQGLDLLGCRGRALRQVAHFGGHHREAAALLAGARRFDRRVQRQDVGLEGDAVDDADDVDDLRDEALIEPMVSTTWRHHVAALAPPLRRPTAASWLAWRALSAFCLTVLVSSSIEAAVCSSELACSSVRDDRSWLPVAIWLEAVAIVSVPVRTSPDHLRQARRSCSSAPASAGRSRRGECTSMRRAEIAARHGLRHLRRPGPAVG